MPWKNDDGLIFWQRVYHEMRCFSLSLPGVRTMHTPTCAAGRDLGMVGCIVKRTLSVAIMMILQDRKRVISWCTLVLKTILRMTELVRVR